MYNINVNYEAKETVIVNFEEMMEEYPEYQDECEEIISSVEKKFSKVVESIDEPQDYYYVITCNNEDSAEEIEEYLEALFEELEDSI